MKYPFSPEVLDALPEELAELFRNLEDTLLEEICSRLKIADQLNEVTVQDIRALRSMGVELEDIKKSIDEATEVGMDKLGKLLDDVVERNRQYYAEFTDLAKITMPDRFVSARDIDAIKNQTKDIFRNITQSMGFMVDGATLGALTAPAKAYQWALDSAELQIMSGGISYTEAIKNATKKLADSGIKTVSWESGHVDQVDVAVRRAVMTGTNQLCQKYAEQSVDFMETDLVEVSAHIGARDVGVAPENHKEWQGKVYRWANKAGNSRGKYPDFVGVTGYGTGPGLGGWNCRHHFFPFYEGVSERTYTDEQLANIDPAPFEYQGKTYTAYEATQQQRRIERTVRKLKRERTAYKAAGLEEDYQDTSIRIRRLNAEYKAFSNAAELPLQKDRMDVLKVKTTTKSVVGSRIYSLSSPKGKGSSKTVHAIGNIDIEKYKVVSENIRTNEVIITDERIQHIKDHHPNDFERYKKYLEDIVENPQYILEDKTPNTAVVLKEYSEDNERIRLILRLAVDGDPDEYKNSVITFLKISEKTFKKYLRNKKILYKAE